MSGVAPQITVKVLLTLINGLFAMSETALISSRKARLKQRAEAGDRGARAALQLADRPVRELMTPRPNVMWLDAEDPPEEILRQAREAGHSFFSVARGGLDDLLGISSVKDAWA